MNLLFVISSLGGGGAEGVMSTLANEMAARGHKVTLITHLATQVYPINDEVNLIDCRNWQYNTFQGGVLSRIYKKISNRFRDYKHLKEIIKKEQPDIVVSFLIQWLWQLILICKRRIPLIFADRNAYEFPLGSPVHNYFVRHALFPMADMFTVMSHYDVAYLHEKYKRIATVPNPLRIDPLSEDEYKKTFIDRKNILACGRITPQKGYDKLIEAFSLIANKYTHWDLDICGGAKEGEPYLNVLKDQTRSLNIENRVHFIGFHKDVASIMKGHSIFCLSSVHEGFPNVLAESMAMGCACVSFDIVTGPREIIIDGLDGLIVENQDVNALAEGLEELVTNEELRYTFGIRAINNIKRFEKSRVIGMWEHLFERVILDYKSKY